MTSAISDIRPTGRRSASGRLLLVAKLLASVAILSLLIKNVALGEAWHILRRMNGLVLALCLVQLALLPVLGALRWRIVLQRLSYPNKVSELARIFWIGMAFNQVLPTSVGGDVVRGWLIHRNGVRLLDATMRILLERAVLLGSLLVIVCAYGWLGSPFVPGTLTKGATIALVAGAVALSLIPLNAKVLDYLPRRWANGMIAHAWTGVRQIVATPWFVPLVLLSLATNINIAVAGWWLGTALALPVSLTVYLIAIPVVTLASLMPISFGGWGVREAVTVSLIAPLTGYDAALVFALTFAIALVISSSPGFLLTFWQD
jgi:uncharacterized membrane protein YbhN (UPF0104 family)